MKITDERINRIHKKGKKGLRHLRKEAVAALSATKGFADRTADNLPTLLPVLAQTQWLNELKNVTASATTKFDKALDAEYLRNGVGGGNHRLFDGGHTLGGAWSNIADMCAKTECSNIEKVSGLLEALWKDVTTLKGLPFGTMEKQTYDSLSGSLNEYGIGKNWTYDALSYDAVELFSAGISVAAVVYFLRTGQIEKLSKAVGAIGIVGILSANPILALVAISSVGYAIATGTDLNARAAAEGIVKASVVYGALLLLPGAFLMQISVAVALSVLLEKGMTKKNYSSAKGYLEKMSSTLLKSFSDRLPRRVNACIQQL